MRPPRRSSTRAAAAPRPVSFVDLGIRQQRVLDLFSAMRGSKLAGSSTTTFAKYNKFCQNIDPGGGADAGAVNLARTSSNLTAYNNGSDRQNLFNQTNLTYKFGTGPTRRTVVFGAEVGHQNGLDYRRVALRSF
jgi:hypothetical protein